MPEFTFEFDQPAKLLNLNDRLHWAAKARLVKEWREGVGWEAIRIRPQLPQIPLPPAAIAVEFPVRTKARHDRDNAVATVKPLTDSLVDVGILTDDSDEWVTAIHTSFRHTKTDTKVKVTLTW